MHKEEAFNKIMSQVNPQRRKRKRKGGKLSVSALSTKVIPQKEAKTPDLTREKSENLDYMELAERQKYLESLIKGILNKKPTFSKNEKIKKEVSLVSGIQRSVRNLNGSQSKVKILNKSAFKKLSSDFSNSFAGLSKSNTPNVKFVPALRRGGVVNEPTLILAGEAGPEMVRPLNATPPVKTEKPDTDELIEMMMESLESKKESSTEALKKIETKKPDTDELIEMMLEDLKEEESKQPKNPSPVREENIQPEKPPSEKPSTDPFENAYSEVVNKSPDMSKVPRKELRTGSHRKDQIVRSRNLTNDGLRRDPSRDQPIADPFLFESDLKEIEENRAELKLAGEKDRKDADPRNLLSGTDIDSDDDLYKPKVTSPLAGGFGKESRNIRDASAAASAEREKKIEELDLPKMTADDIYEPKVKSPLAGGSPRSPYNLRKEYDESVGEVTVSKDKMDRINEDSNLLDRDTLLSPYVSQAEFQSKEEYAKRMGLDPSKPGGAKLPSGLQTNYDITENEDGSITIRAKTKKASPVFNKSEDIKADSIPEYPAGGLSSSMSKTPMNLEVPGQMMERSDLQTASQMTQTPPLPPLPKISGGGGTPKPAESSGVGGLPLTANPSGSFSKVRMEQQFLPRWRQTLG